MSYLTTISKTDTVSLFGCYKCGGLIALRKDQESRAREFGETFYCSFGHPQAFTATEVTRLREQLEASNARAARAERERADAWSSEQKTMKEMSAMKRRAKAGVCPCCQRTFVALSRHMQSKHPEYAK